MMEAVRAWLTSVVLVSVLLSAAQSLIPPGTVRKAAGFTGGLILLLVLLRPVLGADLEHLELDFDRYQAAVEERQEELADALGVSRQTIGSLENGRYNPSILLAFKIARYFETTIEEIFLYEEENSHE